MRMLKNSVNRRLDVERAITNSMDWIPRGKIWNGLAIAITFISPIRQSIMSEAFMLKDKVNYIMDVERTITRTLAWSTTGSVWQCLWAELGTRSIRNIVLSEVRQYAHE